MGVQRVTEDDNRNDDVTADSDWVSALVSSLIVSALGTLQTSYANSKHIVAVHINSNSILHRAVHINK